MSPYPDLVQADLEGNHESAAALAQEALAREASPEDIVESGLQATMVDVGRRYADGEYFVPDMLYSARAVNTAMDVLRPHLTESGGVALGKMVVGPQGVRLSGGQVQRTAAARMFIRGPELMVFDDLSSSLDVETEHELWKRLA